MRFGHNLQSDYSRSCASTSPLEIFPVISSSSSPLITLRGSHILLQTPPSCYYCCREKKIPSPSHRSLTFFHAHRFFRPRLVRKSHQNFRSQNYFLFFFFFFSVQNDFYLLLFLLLFLFLLLLIIFLLLPVPSMKISSRIETPLLPSSSIKVLFLTD